MPSSNQPVNPGSPSSQPPEAHGGSNVRGKSHKQGKEGNGAQKRQQKKKG